MDNIDGEEAVPVANAEDGFISSPPTESPISSGRQTPADDGNPPQFFQASERAGEVVIPVEIAEDRTTGAYDHTQFRAHQPYITGIGDVSNTSTPRSLTLSRNGLMGGREIGSIEIPNIHSEIVETEEDGTVNSPPAATVAADLIGNMVRSQHHHPHLAEYSANFVDGIELPTINSFTTVRTEEVREPIRLRSYSSIKLAIYLFVVIQSLAAYVWANFMVDGHSHSPIANIYTIISVVAFFIAGLIICILFCICDERLASSNSSHDNRYLCYYKILKDVFYMVCFLEFVSLALVLLTLLLHRQPRWSPQTRPHHYHHHRH